MSNRNKTIDAVKGLLILFVIFAHINISINIRRLCLAPFWENSAVPMFLMISGYLYSNSYVKNNIKTLSEAYQPKNIVIRLARFLIPWMIFFVFEILIYAFMRSNFVSLIIEKIYPNTDFINTYIPVININNVINYFVIGGAGEGRYYIPLMILFVLFFPCIHFFVEKYKQKGVLFFAIISTIFNLAYTYLGFDPGATIGTLLCSLFIIAIGIYWSLYDININKKLTIVLMLLGIIYIILVKYLNYEPIIFSYTASRALPACLFWFPLTIKIIKTNNFNNKYISYIGKISFDVLLVQKVFFTFFNVVVYTLFDNLLVQIIVIYIVVIITSVVFSKIENIITNKLIMMIKNKLN